MFSLELHCGPEQRDMLIADLWEQGSTGIVELDESRLRAFFDDEAGEAALLERYAPYRPEPRTEEDRDWVAYAREKLEPMLAGSRFFLVPEWRDDPAPEGRFRIAVNPGMAFGTGAHETTQLAIEALERHVRPASVVLDVGTGSGILAQVAELLGAARVYACDNDPIAVEVARNNVRTAHLFTGSADAVSRRAFDLVVANISPEAIAALAPDLLAALRGGGVALLSGFETHEVEQVRASLGAARILAIHHKNNWALIEART
jgi:ribosomal protein L11 methyltransferase